MLYTPCEYWIFFARNEYHIFQKILKLNYEFPEGFDSDGKEVVEKLLVSNMNELNLLNSGVTWSNK